MKPKLIKLWNKYISQTQQDGIISFASGRPSLELYQFALKKIKKSLLKTTRRNLLQIVDYSPVDGIKELKYVLIKKYQQENVYLKEKDIIITSGSQQALDIFLKSILKPNDKILIAKENYIGLEKTLKNIKAKILILTKNIEKTTYKEFNQLFKKQKIKIFYLASDFSNPTGLTLSLKKRKEIIKMAKKYRFEILEDQIYRDLVYCQKDQLPSLRKLDTSVNFIGSASKIIAPGLRVGWLIVNKSNFEEAYEQKRAFDLQTPFLNQKIIADFMENNNEFQTHLKKIRKYYQEKMEILLSSLKKSMPKEFFWNQTRGGFFVWVEGPKKLDSRILFEKALKTGVGIMPGFVFNYQKPQYNNFRLSISAVPKNQIQEGVKRISQVLESL